MRAATDGNGLQTRSHPAGICNCANANVLCGCLEWTWIWEAVFFIFFIFPAAGMSWCQSDWGGGEQQTSCGGAK